MPTETIFVPYKMNVVSGNPKSFYKNFEKDNLSYDIYFDDSGKIKQGSVYWNRVTLKQIYQCDMRVVFDDDKCYCQLYDNSIYDKDRLIPITFTDLDNNFLFGDKYVYDNKMQLKERKGYFLNSQEVNYSYKYQYDDIGKIMLMFSENQKNSYTYMYYYNFNGDYFKKCYEGSGPFSSECYYDTNNNLIKMTHNYEKNVAEYLFIYDINGKLIEKQWISGNNSIKSVYTYDNDGRIMNEEISGLIDNEEFVVIYDSNGNIVKKREVVRDTFDEYEFKYDSNNNLIQKVYNVNNKQYYSSEYFYDSNGNVVKIITYYGVGDEKELNDQCIYKYDSNGKLIEINHCIGEIESTKPYKYTYNSNNELVSIEHGEAVYNDKGSPLFIKRGEYSQHFLTGQSILVSYKTEQYTYDEHGNLLSLVINYYNGDDELYKTETSNYVYDYDSYGNVIRKEYYENNELVYIEEYEYMKMLLPKFIFEKNS